MEEFLIACERHSVERLRAVLEAGLDPNAPIRGKRPVDWLLEKYTSSDASMKCSSCSAPAC